MNREQRRKQKRNQKNEPKETQRLKKISEFTDGEPLVEFPCAYLVVPWSLIRTQKLLSLINEFFVEAGRKMMEDNESREAIDLMREHFYGTVSAGGGFGLVVRSLDDDTNALDLMFANIGKMDKCRAEVACKLVQETRQPMIRDAYYEDPNLDDKGEVQEGGVE